MEKVGLVLLVVLGAAVIWLPARPPMVDLPQHAGQIALLRDITLGRSPWAREIRVNLFTPYLLGYGLAWALSMLMPVTAAIKLVLTAAYLAMGAICIAIRRELGAAPHLDAYYFLSFFGFAYAIGLYTFLVAAPVGLGFVWLAIRYARLGGAIRGFGLSLLGLALLFSHGLVFLFALALGLGVLGLKSKNPKDAIIRSWPFIAPLAVCAVMFVVTRQRETAVVSNFGAVFEMGPLLERAIYVLFGSFGYPSATWPFYCLVAMAVLPFLGGLTLRPFHAESLLVAASVVAIMLFAPSYAWSTNWLYQRFALFMPAAYAWLFNPPVRPQRGLARLASPYLGLMASAVVGVVLTWHLTQAIAFSRQTTDFDIVLAHAKPGQRALSLPLDTRGSTGADQWVFAYFPVWYQVEKQGFVDFNFAFYHPQVARFRNTLPPLYTDQWFLKAPKNFDWRRDGGAWYHYFFVRHTAPIPAQLFSGADCAPAEVAASGTWALFERRPCTAQIATGDAKAPSR